LHKTDWIKRGGRRGTLLVTLEREGRGNRARTLKGPEGRGYPTRLGKNVESGTAF